MTNRPTAIEALNQHEAILKSQDPADQLKVKQRIGKVLAFRVYAQTTSQRHLEAGALYQLQVSFDTLAHAEDYVAKEKAEQKEFELETYLIRS
jgi:hypothetical protein